MSVGADGRTALWDARLSFGDHWQAHNGHITQVRWNWDGSYIVSSGEDGKVIVWESASTRAAGMPVQAAFPISALDVSDVWIAYSTMEGRIGSIHLVSLTSGESLASQSLSRVARVLAFTHDASTIVVGDEEGNIWRMTTPELEVEPAPILQHSSTVLALAVHPDGNQLASGDRDGHLLIWSIESGQINVDTEISESSITALRFTPDGERLIVGTSRGDLLGWNLAAQIWEPIILRLGSRITDLDVNASGTHLLVTQAFAGTQLFDLATLQPIGQPFTLTDRSNYWSARYSPDGDFIVVGSTNQLVRVGLATEAWMQTACAKANRSLIADERNLYLVPEAISICSE